MDKAYSKYLTIDTDDETFTSRDKPNILISIFHRGVVLPEPELPKHQRIGPVTKGKKLPEEFNIKLPNDQRGVVLKKMAVIKSPLRMSANAPAKQRHIKYGLCRWLMDTGCGWDLADEGDLKMAGMLNIIVKAPRGLRLKTPAGVAQCDNEVPLHIPVLEEAIKARGCPKTPNVLSIGRRCMLDGYSFHWPKLSDKPYLITPSGRKVILEVDGYIPYLICQDEW